MVILNEIKLIEYFAHPEDRVAEFLLLHIRLP